MTHSISAIEHIIEKNEINLTQEVFKASHVIVNFFRKILGLLGVIIAGIVLVVPLLLFSVFFILYFKNRAKTLSKNKHEALKEVNKLSYEELTSFEKKLNSTLIVFTQLRNELRSTQNLLFFRNMYISINSICKDLEEINSVIVATYTYTENDLTFEEIQSANEYWNNVKTKNPKLVQLLDKDNTGNKVIFNSKKLQKDLC